MNDEKKDELQSRRQFFKKAAKGALPILGAIALANMPIIAKASETAMGCSSGCYTSCSNTCSNTCVGGCNSRCSGCGTACGHGCATGCSGGCTGCNGR
jgi:hypothetical protein